MKMLDRIELFRANVHEVLLLHFDKPQNRIREISRWVNLFIAALIVLSSALVFISTFLALDGGDSRIRGCINVANAIIASVFILEYLLRIWTADLEYESDQEKYRDRYRDRGPMYRRFRSRWKFIWSPMALIDLAAILSFCLPVLVSGETCKRLLKAMRVVRVVRLFRYVGRYRQVIKNMRDVLVEQRKELKISLVAIGVLVLLASVLMYAAENGTNAEKFPNAFAGLWWAVSTVTTVGYGDIYPVTPLGRICGIFIAIAGVAAIAIPTAIISSGFMKRTITPEELQRMLSEKNKQQDDMLEKHGKMIATLTSGLEEFEKQQADRLTEFERQQRETDELQNRSLNDQRNQIDEFMKSERELLSELKQSLSNAQAHRRENLEAMMRELRQLADKLQGMQLAMMTKVDGMQQAVTTKVEGVQQAVTTKVEGVQQAVTTKVDDVQQAVHRDNEQTRHDLAEAHKPPEKKPGLFNKAASGIKSFFSRSKSQLACQDGNEGN